MISIDFFLKVHLDLGSFSVDFVNIDLSTWKEINDPLPFLLDERRYKQSNNAGTDYTNDHAKCNEPWRSGRDKRGRQCWIDAQELQSLVRQQEGIVYAVTGLPIWEITGGDKDSFGTYYTCCDWKVMTFLF